MIISTNKNFFGNFTTANAGVLRTFGNRPSQTILALKPSTVLKNAGFLRISGAGYITSQEAGSTISVSIEFANPGMDQFHVSLLRNTVATAALKQMFTFHVDIHVGVDGHSEMNSVFTTSHCNGRSDVLESGAYISGNPDEIWCGTLKYSITNNAAPMPVGNIAISSFIAEYKEN